MKKFICILISCIMLFGSFSVPLSASAAYPEIKSGDFVYKKITKYYITKDPQDDYSGERVYVITDYTGNSEAVTVPAKLDGHKIFAVDDGFGHSGANIESFAKIKKLTFSEGIEYIGRSVANPILTECRNLEELILPDSLEYLSPMAFSNSKICGEVKIGKNLRSGLEPYFVNNNGIKVYGGFINNAGEITKFTVDPANITYLSVDGVVYSRDGETLHVYPNGKKDQVFTVPDDVEYVDYMAFSNNPYLHTIFFESETLATPVGMDKNNKKVFQYENILGLNDNTVVYCHKDTAFAKGLKEHQTIKFAYIEQDEVASVWISVRCENGVKLGWSDLEKADRYRVYRKTPGKSWERVASVTTSCVKIPDIDRYTSYSFKVIAVVDEKSTEESRALIVDPPEQPITGHCPSDWIVERRATCTNAGSVCRECDACGKVLETMAVEATGHYDNNGDRYCDGCHLDMDPQSHCLCDCHKSGLKGFFWIFTNFFNMILGKNRECSCGKMHW